MKSQNFKRLIFGVGSVLALIACSAELEPENMAEISSSSINVSSSSIVSNQWTPDDSLAYFFSAQLSDRQVMLNTQVTRLLSDDLSGDPHQRFIVQLQNQQTLLVAHNIDLAPRVPLQVQDSVQIFGEYEWNAEGGVVHWTHQDPNQQHVDGWIQHLGIVYQ